MNRRYIVIGALVVILAILGWVVSTQFWGPQADTAPTPTGVPAVTLEQTYDEGVHTLSGSIPLADRCQTIAVTALLQSESSIRLDIVRSVDEGLCLELPIDAEFEVEVEAVEEATVQIFVDGTRATLAP